MSDYMSDYDKVMAELNRQTTTPYQSTATALAEQQQMNDDLITKMQELEKKYLDNQKYQVPYKYSPPIVPSISSMLGGPTSGLNQEQIKQILGLYDEPKDIFKKARKKKVTDMSHFERMLKRG